MIKIERATLDAYGEDKLNAEVFAFTRALADHAKTVNVAAPTAHPFVEQIVKNGGGRYEVIEPVPVIPEPAPIRSIDELQAEAFDTIRELRNDAMKTGVMLNGVKFGSTSDTLTALLGADAEAVATGDPSKWVTRWKVGPGSYVAINYANVRFLILAIRAKHSAAFKNEMELSEQVVSAHNAETLARIDLTKGWDE